uniref:Uncharacterized protein n=1 Tax=Triticum urartu TaxID=4572 RepID=A0A8R7UC52_TRIUA
MGNAGCCSTSWRSSCRRRALRRATPMTSARCGASPGTSVVVACSYAPRGLAPCAAAGKVSAVTAKVDVSRRCCSRGADLRGPSQEHHWRALCSWRSSTYPITN